MNPSMPWLLAVVSLGLPAVTFWMLPVWSRPQTWFGVTVAAGFASSEAGRRILSRYRQRLAGVTGLALAIGIVAWPSAWATASILAQVAGMFWAIARANAEARAFAVAPSTVREATLDARPEPTARATWGTLLPYLLMTAAAVVLIWNWDRIPERFPIHWGADGVPNGWSRRTPLGVFGPLLLGTLICVLVATLGRWVHRTARRGPGLEPARIQSILAAVTTFVGALVALTTLSTAFAWAVAPPVIMAAALGGALVLTVFVARAATGVKGQASAAPGPGDGTPDSAWKWGLFYSNPDDPALLVPRRIGLGYDLNFGHREAWWLLGLLALALISLAALTAA